jgi:hypothetical protein
VSSIIIIVPWCANGGLEWGGSTQYTLSSKQQKMKSKK